jgi:hypothetical protein
MTVTRKKLANPNSSNIGDYALRYPQASKNCNITEGKAMYLEKIGFQIRLRAAKIAQEIDHYLKIQEKPKIYHQH